MAKARVLYDFEGDQENSELIVKEGDVVIIVNQDVGDGWWEGHLESGGPTGLFPESYVELIDGGGAEISNYAQADGYHDDMGGEGDDDWDENEDWDEQRTTASTPKASSEQTGTVRSRSPGQGSTSFGRAGTVKKDLNRFSPFVKTGAEAYILGHVTLKNPTDAHTLTLKYLTEEHSPVWDANPNPYHMEIKAPEKKSKFKGLKSFMTYELQPVYAQSNDTSSKAVSRRYKHYVWLHERLKDKFTTVCVPPLPDKEYISRYGENFLEKRRQKLEMWSNRVARHPVLSCSDVFNHFILCDEASQQWKAGKRRAEKDELCGAALISLIKLPDIALDLHKSEVEVENFDNFLKQMENSLLRMKAKFRDHCNIMSGPFMGEWHKMAGVLANLSQVFAMEEREYAKGLNEAMHFASETYRDISQIHVQQPKNDMLPAMDVLKEYLGLIKEFPDMAAIHKGIMGKVKNSDKMKEEGRIDMTDATDITSRSEVISAAVIAEIYHFQHERVVDFRAMMRDMLSEQIKFYQQIVHKLESSLAHFSDDTQL